MSPYKMVFVDVDTQADFMLPNGRLYVPQAESIIPNLARLMEYARRHAAPVLSSVDAHPLDDPEFQQFPPHCVKGTPGQQKIPVTLLEHRFVIPNEKQPPPSERDFSSHSQWILEKQAFDLFTNVSADSLLESFPAERYIVFGVATEYCVKAAVLGLLQRGRPVALVTDAIREIEAESGEAVLQQVQEAGAHLVRTEEIVSESLAATSS